MLIQDKERLMIIDGLIYLMNKYPKMRFGQMIDNIVVQDIKELNKRMAIGMKHQAAIESLIFNISNEKLLKLIEQVKKDGW